MYVCMYVYFLHESMLVCMYACMHVGMCVYVKQNKTWGSMDVPAEAFSTTSTEAFSVVVVAGVANAVWDANASCAHRVQS